MGRPWQGELELIVGGDGRRGAFPDDLPEELKVMGANNRPEHLLAVETSAALDRALKLGVIEEAADGRGDALGGTEVHEHAAAFVEQKASV